nr:probable E3 ubiquitin-protein ligase DTX2 isoform X1 [Procambarus clarkii]
MNTRRLFRSNRTNTSRNASNSSSTGSQPPAVVQLHEGAEGGSQNPEHASLSTVDKLLADYTRQVSSPPDEICSICIVSLRHQSGFNEDIKHEDSPGNASCSQGSNGFGTVQLVRCKHIFHFVCVKEMVKASPKFLQCPYCKAIYGIRQGNQPQGSMKVEWAPYKLPGHPDCGTIIIKYSFKDGIQGPEHPNPGEPYRAHAFPRVAFLPDNTKGNKVLKLLQEAWKRRLIFTVGTSATSGLRDVIVWNDIHHKTEPSSNISGHGYPDEFYLDTVLMELEIAGVTDATTE